MPITQVIIALEKKKDLSEDFLQPVWELWPEDVDEAVYRAEIPEPMDLKTLNKRVHCGG
jgi:hypothetical protein